MPCSDYSDDTEAPDFFGLTSLRNMSHLLTPREDRILTLHEKPNLAAAMAKTASNLERGAQGGAPSERELVQQLSRSQVYQDYKHAFQKVTGLPLLINAPLSTQYDEPERQNLYPLCALLASSTNTCAACRDTRRMLSRRAEVTSITCYAGLRETSVPVRTGERVVAYLSTGRVLLQKQTPERFQQLIPQMIERGCRVNPERLERAYFQCRVVSPSHYAGIVHLLEIFAAQLGMLSNQIVLQQESRESPFSRRIKAYIAGHMSDPLHLAEVARTMHMSTFYFCKMFKRATGITFTDYLGRVRVERAKALLLDPHQRVGEVAYEVGFGSLTHFNRVFRRLVGQSPSDYRQAALGSLAAQSARSLCQSARSTTAIVDLV